MHRYQSGGLSASEGGGFGGCFGTFTSPGPSTCNGPAPPRVKAIRPVLDISLIPKPRRSSNKELTFSSSPVTSTISESEETSTILALKISTIWMISLRVEAVALTLTKASSRTTLSSLVISTILTTSTTLSSCFLTCSTLASSPSTTIVIRDRLGCPVCPTAMLSMLHLRRLKRLDTRLSTPGLSSTKATKVCFVLANNLVLLLFYFQTYLFERVTFSGPGISSASTSAAPGGTMGKTFSSGSTTKSIKNGPLCSIAFSIAEATSFLSVTLSAGMP